MLHWLRANEAFPPVEQALQSPNGLLAAGADLSPARLLDAYSRGIFPWFSVGQPILWWSPHPRLVLRPHELNISRSLRKTLAKRPFEIRADSAFRAVIRACAEPRSADGGTWITAEMIGAYCELHRLGYAHSIECWCDGELVGGLYGVALGRAFFGESMFARRSDASKVALVHLVRHLQALQFGLIDCQMYTSHLVSLGAREMPRREFCAQLTNLVHFHGSNAPWILAQA
jgi:leucyl/phenylalanyl-tRNA---protein transferase